MKIIKIILSLMLIILCSGCGKEDINKSEKSEATYKIVEMPSEANVENLFNITNITQISLSEVSKTYDSIAEKGVFKVGEVDKGSICWKDGNTHFVYTKDAVSEQSLVFYASQHINDEAISYQEFLENK
ncbi:MAG: hypothetical protein KHZ15_01795 [Coprobacillus cateniformis]|uniref:hypothetical protein n=1 Tax=Longibaculum muris TaxID=1796628 RepID=UPI00189C8E2C|nr:hypothetical protein [Longibaculum muris]MBS5111401.1 hypothetical protein [Coprobacillus cateniformis]